MRALTYVTFSRRFTCTKTPISSQYNAERERIECAKARKSANEYAEDKKRSTMERRASRDRRKSRERRENAQLSSV
jgi:hypothetical protein